MTQPLTSRFIFITHDASGMPSFLTAAPTDETSYIALTELDLAHECNCTHRFGYMSDGTLLAQTLGDDTVIKFAIATFNKDGMLMFADAQVREQMGELMLSPKAMAQMLTKVDGTPITFDPRKVVMKALSAGLGHDLPGLVVKVEGDELVFSKADHSNVGTTVETKTLSIAGKAFIVARAGDIVLAAPVTKSGDTWIARGNIGHVKDVGTIEDLLPTALAAFGIGIPTAALSHLVLPVSDHGKPLATAAA